jgi:aminoglycoside 6'-N-acetyltransferase
MAFNVRGVHATGHSSVPRLVGNGATLRPVEEPDLPRLVTLLQDPEVAAWWGAYDEPRLREDLADEGLLAWTIEVDGAVAGFLQATEESEPDYRSVEVDLFLAAPLHGRGHGSDALRTALRWLFEEHGHHRATIVPAAENARAIRSYERVGFRPVGIMRRAERAPDGRWRDSLAMDLLAGQLR